MVHPRWVEPSGAGGQSPPPCEEQAGQSVTRSALANASGTRWSVWPPRVGVRAIWRGHIRTFSPAV